MKKILHISANQLPDPDQSHHTVLIWEELAKAFDEYHIIGRSKTNSFRYAHKNNIHLHLVPAFGKRNRSFFISSFYMFHLIRKHKITHLLSQSSIWGGFTGTLAAKIFRIPHMVEIHGDVYFKYAGSNNFIERILARISRFSLQKATIVRSLSSKMTADLNQMGIDRNIVEIPNRVNLERFKPPKENYQLNNPIEIISVGRFVNQKGYELAIKSIKQLQEKYPVRLRLIGGGKLKSKLEQLVGENTNIELIDWMDQKGLIDQMRRADIYIQPSLPFFGEAMPRTILEAMAMGLPIISSKIAAIPGILYHDKNARLVAPGNVDDLENQLEELINDQSLREKLGRQAFSDASLKYEWNKLFDLYRNTLSGMS